MTKEGKGFNIIGLLQVILLAAVIGVAASKFYFAKPLLPHHDVKQEAEVITEKINAVSKMVLVEGTFSEIFTYKDDLKMFYDYFSFEKKAILKVNAKAAISIDLTKMKYYLDETNKQIVIDFIPEPELMLEPDIQYYDIQQSSFNEFSTDEFNKMNKDALKEIRRLVKDSDLYDMAKGRMVDVFQDLQLFSEYMNWEIVDRSGSSAPLHFDEINIIME